MAETRTVSTDQVQQHGTDGNGAKPDDATPPRGGARRGLIWGAVAVVALLLIVMGVRFLHFSSTHTSTDDAYVSSDVIQIAPQVGGTLQRVLVSDNQVVTKGQLLAVLDDSTARANLAQAQANLDAAIAQASGAGATVNVTQETGSAMVEQAKGQIAQADAGIAAARQAVSQSDAAVAASIAQSRSASSNINTLQAAVGSAVAAQSRAAAAVQAAQAQITGAQANVSSAQAGIEAAQAAYERTVADAQRYASLAQQGAGSRQMADQAATTERAALAALQAARQEKESAIAGVSARESDLTAAKAQYSAAVADVAQARAKVVSARDQAAASRASIQQAQAQRNVAAQEVGGAQAKLQQAMGQMSAANVSPRQVAVSRSAHSQATAKIEQARAALDQARLQLGYTRIFAPAAGRVSKKSAEVGSLVQPGTPLMAIIPQNDVWLIANLKETQMRNVSPGDAAVIRVDAVPGREYHGRVQSISPATGSTFALLPPDNASGNFTKVVQRIPVKIVFDRDQPGLERLRAGMSVDVTITTG